MNFNLDFRMKDPELIELWSRLVSHATAVESKRASFYENVIDTEWKIHARRGVGGKSSFVYFTKVATSDVAAVSEPPAGMPLMVVYTGYEVNMLAPIIWRTTGAADVNSDSRMSLFEQLKEKFKLLMLVSRTNVLQPDAEELRHLLRFIEQSHHIDKV